MNRYKVNRLAFLRFASVFKFQKKQVQNSSKKFLGNKNNINKKKDS